MTLNAILKLMAVCLLLASTPFVWPWLEGNGVSPLIGFLLGGLNFGLMLFIMKKL